MDFREILAEVKRRWILSEKFELITQLDEAPQGASSGTEGIGMIGQFLLRLKQSDPDAFNEVKDLVDEFAKKCAETRGPLIGYNNN